MGGKDAHQAPRGVDVGPHLEFEEALEAARDARVAKGDAVREPKGPHHHVIDRPGDRGRARRGSIRSARVADMWGRAARSRLRNVRDETRGADKVLGLLPGVLPGAHVGGVEARNGLGFRERVEAAFQHRPGVLDQAALQQAREGQVDLLADDGPQDSVEDARGANEAQPGAAGDEAPDAKLSGQPGEGGGILLDPEHGDCDGVGGPSVSRRFRSVHGDGDKGDAPARELERQDGRVPGQADRCLVGVSGQAFRHALRVAAEGPQRAVERIVVGQRHRECSRRVEPAVFGGGHAVRCLEMVVEHREGLEPYRARDLGEHVARFREEPPRRVDPGPREEVRGRRVEVLPEELEAAGRPKTGTPDDRAGVGEARGVLPDLGDEGLYCLKDGIRTPREVIRMAFEARAEAALTRGLDRREKPDVLALRLLRLARGDAVDPGREDAREEPPVPGGVPRGKPGVHGGFVDSHGRGSTLPP